VLEGLSERARALLSGRSEGDSLPVRRSRILAAVITGTYSWALTVLPPLSVHGSASVPGALAGLALLSLLLSPLVGPGPWTLVFALDLFVGFSIASWLTGSHQPMEPPFAVFGSFGWLAYTLALGALSTPDAADRPADPGPLLPPRTRPRRLSALVLGVVVALVLVILGAAWQVERPAVAVLSHVVALATVLLALRSGAQLATYVQVGGTKLARPLSLRAAIAPLLGLALLAFATFVLVSPRAE
jgi:hypothetical protein